MANTLHFKPAFVAQGDVGDPGRRHFSDDLLYFEIIAPFERQTFQLLSQFRSDGFVLGVRRFFSVSPPDELDLELHGGGRRGYGAQRHKEDHRCEADCAHAHNSTNLEWSRKSSRNRFYSHSHVTGLY